MNEPRTFRMVWRRAIAPLLFLSGPFALLSSCSAPPQQNSGIEAGEKAEPEHFGFRELPEDAAPGWTSVQVSFHNSEDGHLFDRSRNVHGVRLNLWGGTARAVNGLDVGLVGMLDSSMSGIQSNLVVSSTRGTANGLQVAALGSYADYLNGFQVSAVNGGARVRGLQVGVLASTAAEVEGIQLGGLYCGGFKKPPEVTGVQLSLVNWATELSGVQIGLVNFNRGGWLPFFPLLNLGIGTEPEETE